jgi:hypothetical protein
MRLTLPKGLSAEKETGTWIVSPSVPPTQQPPPAICTDPVTDTDAVVDIASGVMAVGVSDAVGVRGWPDGSVAGVGVSVSVDGITIGEGVELGIGSCPREGVQEAVIKTIRENRMRVFIVVLFRTISTPAKFHAASNRNT